GCRGQERGADEQNRANRRDLSARWLSALGACDRRPRQPRDARSLSEDLQGGSGGARAALADRARATSRACRHPALCTTRRDRIDAIDTYLLRCADGGAAPGGGAGEG